MPTWINAAGKPARLTDTLARTIPPPEPLKKAPAKRGGIIPPSTARYEIWWCPKTPGFGLRVSSTGDRAYIAERRVDGKTTRRTLGKAAGAGAISAEAARQLQVTVSSELQAGVDRAEVKREERKVEKLDAVTLADALRAYVKGKRRGKDGLALKDRTKADYLAMIEPGGVSKAGKPFADGPLFALAETSIQKMSADGMRKVYEAAAKSSKRRAIYAMQVLRAVLNWHGVQVEDSPLAKTTAGKARIVLSGTAGRPTPIPPEKLGAWWQAASAMAGGDAADGCRLILLTGCRSGEIFGSAYQTGLLVGDVDLDGARFTLIDTKNRADHTVMMSKQALAIVAAHCDGKKATAKLFDVLDPGKTLATINATCKVKGITPHKLRHTFASVAEELVSGYALKRMMNHTDGADVTGAHYVGKSEAQLRAAWQAVADFIVERAKGTR
jgi:integrase